MKRSSNKLIKCLVYNVASQLRKKMNISEKRKKEHKVVELILKQGNKLEFKICKTDILVLVRYNN